MLMLSYLCGSVLRGLLICGSLLLAELVFRRRIMFAGAGKLYAALFILAVLPCGMLDFSPLYERLHREPAPAAVTAAVPSPRPAAKNPEAEKAPKATVTAAENPMAVSAQAFEFPALFLQNFDPRPQPGGEAQAANWILAIYFVIALGLTAKRLRQFFVWRGKIRRCFAITGGRVFDIFQEAKRKVGLGCNISLLDGSSLLPTPASFNCLPGRALLCPLAEVEKLSDAELEMLMTHELGHFKHSDNLAALFGALLADLLWINVFLRFLLARFAFARELDCDALVRCKTGAKSATYARLLLAFQIKANHIPVAGLGAAAENLKLRIEEFSMKNQFRHRNLAIGGAVLLACCGALASPALAGGNGEITEPPAAQATPAAEAAVAAAPEIPASKILPEEWGKLVPSDAATIAYFTRGDVERLGSLTGGPSEMNEIVKKFPSVSQLMLAGNPGYYDLVVRSETPITAPQFEDLGNGFYRITMRRSSDGSYQPEAAGDRAMGISAKLLAEIDNFPAATRSFIIMANPPDNNDIGMEMLRLSIGGDGHDSHIQFYAKIPNAENRKKVEEAIRNAISIMSAGYETKELKPSLKIDSAEDGILKIEASIPDMSVLDIKFTAFLLSMQPTTWLYSNARSQSQAFALLSIPGGKERLEKFAEDCRQKLLSGQYSPDINGYPIFFHGWKITAEPGKRAAAAKLLMSDYMLICDLTGKSTAPVELFEELDKTRKEMADYTFAVVRNALVADGKMELAAKYCSEPYKEFEKSADIVLPYISNPQLQLGAVYEQAGLLRACGESLLKIAEYKKLTDDAAKIKAGIDKLNSIVEKRKSELPPPPHVVSISPANGATDVSPDVTEIVVTFDRPMRQHSWAFCQNPNLNYPETTGKPNYNSPTTVVLPVKLKPKTKYNIWLNSGKFIGFVADNGGVLESYAYTFTTAEK